MTLQEIQDKQCDGCGQPLFLDKDECKSFIGNKLKEGYIVCGCCSGKQQVEKN